MLSGIFIDGIPVFFELPWFNSVTFYFNFNPLSFWIKINRYGILGILVKNEFFINEDEF